MQLNKFIDHTLLKADATTEDIVKLCLEAKKYQFMSVCVNPFFVPVCKALLRATPIKVCTVIGFPLGASMPKVKAFEAAQAVREGADEVDMVINVAMAKEKNFDYISEEVAMVRAAIPGTVVLKVILECCYLDKRTMVKAAGAARDGGADFVKTSTGFSSGGATVEDVRLMRGHVDPRVKVKAAGGIRTADAFLDMVRAGAERIGCSAGVAIVEELASRIAASGTDAIEL